MLLAMACPVCFGNSDAPMAKATNTGIIFMIVVVGVVLVGFAAFFINLIRRANASSAVDDAAAAFAQGASAPKEASRYIPEKGTA